MIRRSTGDGRPGDIATIAERAPARLRGCGLVAALSVTFLACTAPAPPATVEKPKLLVLGLDGLDPALVRRWVADGALPNIGGLIDRGLMTTIDCVVGTSSPVVWTTIATGVTPLEHGVTGFQIDDDPVNASHRVRPAFWNILPAYDFRVATIGWMVTWPAENDSGIVVSDRAWWGNFENKTAPPGIVEPRKYRVRMRDGEIASLFTTYEFDEDWERLSDDDPRYAVHYLLQHRLANIYRRDNIYAGVAREVATHNGLDVLAVYFQGADYVSHGLWQYFDPEPFRKAGWKIDPKDAAALGTIIPEYYRFLDRLVGQMVSLADPEALIVLLSDHGERDSTSFRNNKNYSVEARFLSGTHRNTATLILAGPQIRRGAQPKRRVTHFDILPTLLYALDLPLARDQPGRALEELFTDGFAATRTREPIATYAREGAPVPERARSDLDPKILDELRSLGYID